jgi:putative nucleotidyltransferase with HDIG domain
MAVLDGNSVRRSLHAFVGIWPTVALNIGLAVALAGIYSDVGLSALAFMLLLIAAFTYMARLLVEARERTRQYANLSWGVLSGLIRTLDERDSRAARHCAAVAAFSRDMAKHVGMNKRDQELAHTAGLLHDIGKFALSDRVMERGAKLLESDWRGIRRHPDIGAELLRDIGVYGPVAEIIRAHHERIDGRGYPSGLKGEDIPPIAKIVAVAEVYDTLTAPDTYRTPMTSFEALNELRRVTGTQLDGVCVEALAELLAGRGTDYRHADDADFDRELDIERRMNEAVAP